MEEIWLTNWWGKHPIIYGGVHISQLVQDFFHQLYHVNQKCFTLLKKKREHRKLHIFPKKHVVKKKGTYQVSPVFAAHNLGSKTPGFFVVSIAASKESTICTIRLTKPHRWWCFFWGESWFFSNFEMGVFIELESTKQNPTGMSQLCLSNGKIHHLHKFN